MGTDVVDNAGTMMPVLGIFRVRSRPTEGAVCVFRTAATTVRLLCPFASTVRLRQL